MDRVNETDGKELKWLDGWKKERMNPVTLSDGHMQNKRGVLNEENQIESNDRGLPPSHAFYISAAKFQP